MTAIRFVLASRNQHKCRELSELIQPLGIQLLAISSFPEIAETEETGTTFAENAAIKAEAASQQTGLHAIADDSGLEVDALNNEPGIYSARFAGPGADDIDNNRLLLERMANVPEEKRQARFVCVIAYKCPGRPTITFRGEAKGKILTNPVGTGGFGYDPLFLSDDLGITFAQAAAEQKNRVSHRAKALQKLVSYLKDRADLRR